ncbi:MAG: HAMP domain-containing histidine kinase, partial [Prevotella sp.]|nr:HAMP domain-containing histidine kinase [Prevotella sp.]
MATHLRTKSFQRNLFLSVGGLFLLFAICFSLYQYKRERQFKTDILDAQLQAYCYEMMQSLGRDSILNPRSFNLYVSSHHVEGLRITIVNLKGEVLLDSSEDYHKIKENHSSRKEIADALKSGKGYDIKRTSSSTHKTYFYTAVRLGDIIVRAAVPYSAELTRSLRADNTYLYFAITLTLLLGIVLYLNTSRIGKHIEYLREFAQKAERGEKLDHELERQLPDDELGDISHTIISLYWKLHHSMEDKARLKRQLTQNVAHELKTPAASIQGYLESILENPDMPEEKKQHFLRHCYAQSMRMSKLLLDMSTLTKLEESPTLSLDQSEVINVLELIRSVISDVSLDLERQGIIVELNVENSVKVKADRTALYSVFR